MAEVKSGDTVQIHYTGTLQDGTTFDSSEGRDPLEFVVGSGQIIPGLDSALPGMAEGDKKVVQVPSEEAYGPVNPEMRQSVPREGIPADIPLDPGTQLQMQTPDQGAFLAIARKLRLEVVFAEPLVEAVAPVGPAGCSTLDK